MRKLVTRSDIRNYYSNHKNFILDPVYNWVNKNKVKMPVSFDEVEKISLRGQCGRILPGNSVLIHVLDEHGEMAESSLFVVDGNVSILPERFEYKNQIILNANHRMAKAMIGRRVDSLNHFISDDGQKIDFLVKKIFSPKSVRWNQILNYFLEKKIVEFQPA
ncbi:hypothetical protein K8Q94_00625 [Candidatus Nomurabacteria bacterium]|nr:hypothetical protein [Candidatus Nomurabacteria bacterium]